MVYRIGMLTIGQSPRTDVVPEISSVLGEEFEVVEAGALDDLSDEEIAAISPRQGETVYVSRLRDGREVKISKEKLIPLLENKIKFLESLGVDAIGLLCSGTFPPFKVKVPLVRPEPILRGLVEASISANQVLGVIMPSSLQISMGYEKWSSVLCEKIVVESVSPYISEEKRFKILSGIASKFRRENVKLVVMDCIGFSMRDAAFFKSKYSVPTLIPRVLLALGIKALLANDKNMG
ncbi:MAG: hypothetical protein DRJ26_00650 [Candidatus Methanomethylicota archaeon]|uniref:AroM family protein n=1 Tax=Thermoproteota archaeon TaxID=2056631 RepID=A0A497EXQ1_9CREN|nr:MAG: hypothetical protein DRJ20_01095 [Candidatus Verstraetearchaeota archaeon]RLE55570.1 MAG: hypothetical protein DRJ26_00650 [Candidatus Verstraetearchaeota archaeon]